MFVKSDLKMERLVSWINKLGYSRYNMTPDCLKEAVSLGMMSEVYTCLISWLSHELQSIEKYESCINPARDVTEHAAFIVELSTFLREVDCPYLAETLDFSNSSDFGQKEWLLVLDYLVGELAFAKLNQARQTETQELEIKMPESETAKGLRESLQTLNVSKPPPNVTGVQLFSKIDSKVKEIMEKNPQIIKEPIFSGTLTEKQWDALECLLKDLTEEYTCRKEVLLQRLDVTIQSFKWGETGKKRNQDISRVYQQQVATLLRKPAVTIANILAARENILEEEKTSGSSVREGTKCALNQVIIGAVPDRGGRPEDQQPPPPEVPSWKTGPKPANPPPSSGGFSHGSSRDGGSSGSFGGHTGSRYKGSDDSRFSDYSNRGYQSSYNEASGRSQNNFDSGFNDNVSSGRHTSNVYKSDRGGGSDRYRGRGSHDYENINRGTSSSLDNGSLGHYAPNRPFVPGDAFSPYVDNQSQICNPPSHNMGHLESAYLPGYGQPAFRPMYQPAMGFGGYGAVPSGGIGGYGASGGNYEQNAPYVQSYQSSDRGQSRGRQSRGGRGPRRGGRSRDGY